MMVNENIFLSLCIPTNGITEWVLPVLESIYSQQANCSMFEVVITDNGFNDDFYKGIEPFIKKYNNLRYYKTKSIGFLNQIDCFRLANGKLVKFVNHRMKLKQGTIDFLISISKEYSENNPVIYFSNGKIKSFKDNIECDSFNDFVSQLSYYVSWSGGLAIWRSKFNDSCEMNSYNHYFPHINILFSETELDSYLIINKTIFEEIQIDETKKGKYNLFYAFSVELLRLLLEQLYLHNIDIHTFNKIRHDNKKFVTYLYMRYIILKTPCSYYLDEVEDSLNVFYNAREIKIIGCVKAVKQRVKSLKKAKRQGLL